MIFKWCPHCGRYGGFCRECKTHLVASKSDALYRYQGMLRSVILRAKVNNENTAYTSICDLFTCHPTVIEMGLHADLIVPVPSSLWGRVRGRYDLAQGMALALGRSIDRAIELLPPFYYFNYRKRAGANNQGQSRIFGGGLPEHWRERKILLVDDIITTGFTMNSLTSLIQSHVVEVSSMALASAKS